MVRIFDMALFLVSYCSYIKRPPWWRGRADHGEIASSLCLFEQKLLTLETAQSRGIDIFSTWFILKLELLSYHDLRLAFCIWFLESIWLM